MQEGHVGMDYTRGGGKVKKERFQILERSRLTITIRALNEKQSLGGEGKVMGVAKFVLTMLLVIIR